MESGNKKFNTIVKTDLEITLEFKKQVRLKSQSLPEALEKAMKLYIKEAKKGDK